ncbi:hypothetical protein SAMN05661091_4682 [Paenibacillus uliginis N3/975]|uniref:Uncharacterized protein n=1 Tax=Paenibacillus uliginis N3/975 TaxID=1313296 RepID=A0A1X7HMN0_9BACL|nr:hypothetical protein [Paenibacillus uliginis]SMF89532.1 hypothetical protein SAMN05661091_4682 [Paenibacillus uliginis N3/975]
MDKLRILKIITLLPLLWATGSELFDNGHTAHAGYFNDVYDNFQQFSELPDEISELKDRYQNALKDLDRARIDTEIYQKQNADLAEQNRQLTEMVEQLQEAEAARARNSDRLKTIAITTAALLAGYFILIRVLRFVMRRTNRF